MEVYLSYQHPLDELTPICKHIGLVLLEVDCFQTTDEREFHLLIKDYLMKVKSLQ